MKLNKKLLGLGLSVILSSGMLIGCSDNDIVNMSDDEIVEMYEDVLTKDQRKKISKYLDTILYNDNISLSTANESCVQVWYEMSIKEAIKFKTDLIKYDVKKAKKINKIDKLIEEKEKETLEIKESIKKDVGIDIPVRIRIRAFDKNLICIDDGKVLQEKYELNDNKTNSENLNAIMEVYEITNMLFTDSYHSEDYDKDDYIELYDMLYDSLNTVIKNTTDDNIKNIALQLQMYIDKIRSCEYLNEKIYNDIMIQGDYILDIIGN